MSRGEKLSTGKKSLSGSRSSSKDRLLRVISTTMMNVDGLGGMGKTLLQEILLEFPDLDAGGIGKHILSRGNLISGYKI